MDQLTDVTCSSSSADLHSSPSHARTARLSITPKEFQFLSSPFNPHFCTDPSTSIRQSPKSFLLHQQQQKRFQIHNWNIRIVDNDIRETGIPQERCPYWIVVEGRNAEGTFTRQSSRIVERLALRLVKTWSGSEYELIGPPLETEAAVNGLCGEFVRCGGFPSNWKELVAEEFSFEVSCRTQEEASLETLPHSKTMVQHSKARTPKKASPPRCQHRQKLPVGQIEREKKNHLTPNSSNRALSSDGMKTPNSPAIVAKVTRSGRKSVKPLQFWNNVYRKDIAN